MLLLRGDTSDCGRVFRHCCHLAQDNNEDMMGPDLDDDGDHRAGCIFIETNGPDLS